MPAYEEEVREAEGEGVHLEFLAAPSEVLCRNGRISALKYQRMCLGEFDRSGRRRPVPLGEERLVESDLCILAIGQALDLESLDGTMLKMSRGNTIEVDPRSAQTSVEWVFAGGDAVTGPASVVDAVGGGEKAAVGIDCYLTGESHAFWRAEKTPDTFFDPDADPVEYPRARIPLAPVKERIAGFREIESCLKQEVALREAKRCLRCDYREQA